MTDSIHYAPGQCSLSGTLQIMGERWSFLILREALMGVTRFSDFASHLGLARNLLSTRLTTLVDAGLMERVTYQDAGSRSRDSYRVTDLGRELSLALSAIQQWGDDNIDCLYGPVATYQTTDGRRVTAAFVDDSGNVVRPAEVVVERIPS